jgi:type VI secretion system secreted protein VgrG
VSANDPPLVYELATRSRTDELRVVHGEEALSQPFALTLKRGVVSAESTIDPFELPGTVAHLMMRRGSRELRRLRGIITSASLAAKTRGAPVLELRFEPELVRARLRHDSRIFRDMTAPAIVEAVLAEAGVKVEMRLSGSYAQRPFTAQYRESDYGFVSRLMEEEGIFYFFRNEAEGHVDDDVAAMICGDSAQAYDVIPADRTLELRPLGLDKPHEKSVDRIHRRARMAASKVSLRDFDTATPSLDIVGEAETSFLQGPTYHDFPARVRTPAAANRRARLVAESVECARQGVGARALSGRLSPGACFDFTQTAPLVEEGGYVVSSLRHDWRADQDAFAVAIEALPETTTFRPTARTPRPHIATPIPGYTVGPAGTDIHVNDLGEVKVHFPWDRRQPHDDGASYWVPVAQDDTGQSMSFPRVGWEVMVGFVDGDPDRPVVLGRMYNAKDPFPEVLPRGKTMTSLRSQSSPGRVGYNEIKLDDALGSELMTIQAQKDQLIEIEHDKTETILRTESSRVSAEETIEIGHDSTQVVGVDRKTTVDDAQSVTVGAARTRKVGAGESADVMGSRQVAIAAAHTRKAGAKDVTTSPILTELVSAADIESSLKPNTTDAEMIEAYVVGGALVELSVKDKEEFGSLARVETIGGVAVSDATEEQKIEVTGVRTTKVGGLYQVEGADGVVLGGTTNVSLHSLATVSLEGGSAIVLKVKGSSVSLSGGLVAIKSKSVTINGDANADLAIDSGTHN